MPLGFKDVIRHEVQVSAQSKPAIDSQVAPGACRANLYTVPLCHSSRRNRGDRGAAMPSNASTVFFSANSFNS